MGSSVLEDPRQRPMAANESGDTPMSAALSQSPPEAAQAGLASRSVNRSQKHGYDRHHRQFDDLSWPRGSDSLIVPPSPLRRLLAGFERGQRSSRCPPGSIVVAVGRWPGILEPA